MSSALRQDKAAIQAMKNGAAMFLCLLAWAFPATAQDEAQLANHSRGISYMLLDGSYFVDDCLICGRPTIQQPLRGTFDLVLLQNTPPYTKCAVKNIDFTAGPGFAGEVHITGGGIYERFEEFARLQDMELTVQVKDGFTNRFVLFTNLAPVAQLPSPLIKISLMQSNGTWIQTFSLDLFAAPLREIWFSTTKALISTNRSSPANSISPGDLISNRGRVVKSNFDLVRQLGVMPIVPDLGLDAVQVTRRGEILFSIPRDVFSELLGLIQHGDLLSSRGAIVKRNQQLLAAFGLPASRPDAGLDAVQVMPDGEILFSIQSNVVVNVSQALSRGDILSDRGQVFRTNRELLAQFHPAVTNRDFGLDALRLLPGGEIWFSVEEDFVDNWIGTVRAGDLLSDRGYRVFSNQQLVAAFAPSDSSQDYGLDALFVVTDVKPHVSLPWITRWTRAGTSIHMEWDGEGDVFQLEHAQSLSGPWLPCSEILPDLSLDVACDLTAGKAGFYRLRQW